MRPLLRVAFLCTILGAVAIPLCAQATRTWVSGVGDDVNPCSRTAPCKTFAGAISKTAPGGEIDALDPGGFGAVTITKSITIDGGGGQVASVLTSGTNGINVSAGTTDYVVLRNLGVHAVGDSNTSGTKGIAFLSGARLVIEGCDVFGYGKRGISIESSTAGAVVTISNTTVRDNQTNGIIIAPPSGTINVTLFNVRAVNNVFYGIGVSGANGVLHVRHSISSNNIGGGLLVSGGTAEVTDSSITGNGTGVNVQASGKVYLGLSTLTQNATLFSNTGGSIFSYGDNYMTGVGFGLTAIGKQ